MDTEKGLITRFGEWLDARQARRREAAAQPHAHPRLAGWLPTRGNVIFTLLMIGLLVVAQTVGALPLGRPQGIAPTSTSTSTIAYQGRLADAAGAPLTGTYNMIFRLYDSGTGGTPLWEEQWTGPNGVRVSDGLFNVMLGSLTPIPASLITDHSSLFLGITVGTDDEMTPRVQLGSVPFAVQALTVPDGSVTTAKIADGAVTQGKLGTDVNLVPPDGSITTAKIADSAVTTAKIVDGAVTSAKLALGVGGGEAIEGGFARDLSTASGDQAISSLSFQPKALIVMFVINGTGNYGQGFATGPSNQNVVLRFDTDGKFYAYSGEDSAMIEVALSDGTHYAGKLKSFDSNGFTITWTRVGSPTGVLWIKYLAFR